MEPLLILAIGIFTIIFMIAALRVNAFLALLTSAIIVSLLAPGEFADKISRVAVAFGSTAGHIGIVIALAVVIGKCMMDSGAADRIVRAFLSLLGEKRGHTALMASGFVLSVPVFFDTVFYLLVPLARSMYRRTGRHFVKYSLAIAAGGVITHSIVPPTPGPLVMAEQLGIDLGVMILIGAGVAIVPAVVAMLFATWLDRRTNIPMRPLGGGMQESEPIPDDRLPGLLSSLLPILLPVVLVSAKTAVSAAAKTAAEGSWVKDAVQVMGVIGDVNFAMLLSAAIAMWILKTKRGLTRAEMANVVEVSLMSAGIVILITAAGGAFGAMLTQAGIGDRIQELFAGGPAGQSGGIVFLVLGVLIASLMKIAQGSGTVAMITASAMIAAMIPSTESLGYPPVLLATAIGGGSMICSWMNDSGFWVFVKMTGMTEAEGLKTWTPMIAVSGFSAALVSLAIAIAWQAPLQIRVLLLVIFIILLGLAAILPGRLGVRRQ